MTAPIRSLARLAAPGIIFFLGACSSRTPVAEVNGTVITKAELAAQVRVFQSVRPGMPDDEGTRRMVLEQLVNQALLVQAAKREGLDKDPGRQTEISRRRTALRQELEKGIADQQAQLATLDEAVETKALIDALSQAKRPGITVTAKDLKAAYDLRAQREAMPPLDAVRDQLLEQVLLDRLVEQARQGAKVAVHLEALK
jgi:hypothetical protein